MSNGDSGAVGSVPGLVACQARNAAFSGSGNRVDRYSATGSFAVAVACTHWANSATWIVSLRLATPSSRDASIRAAPAWLNEIAIAPPHLAAWNPLHAVSTAVTDNRITATSSRQSRPLDCCLDVTHGVEYSR